MPHHFVKTKTERHNSQSYSPPKFEDTTAHGARAKAQRVVDRSDEMLDQVLALVEEGRDWVRLGTELVEAGVDTVAELSEDRQRYWKSLLDKPLTVTL